MEESEFSLEDRIPCSDDTCIGIIGENGICGTCGKPHDGEIPTKFDHGKVQKETPDKLGESEGENEIEKEKTFDPEERVNCPDDMCVGIIGEDGKCGVCGKGL